MEDSSSRGDGKESDTGLHLVLVFIITATYAGRHCDDYSCYLLEALKPASPSGAGGAASSALSFGLDDVPASSPMRRIACGLAPSIRGRRARRIRHRNYEHEYLVILNIIRCTKKPAKSTRRRIGSAYE
jgi:hypothetical protein